MPPLPPVQPRPPPRSSQSSRNSQSLYDLYDAEAQGEMSLATFSGPVKRKKSSKSGTKSARQSTSGSPTSPGSSVPATSSPLTRSQSDGAVGTLRSSMNASSGSLPGSAANGYSHDDVPPVPPIPASVAALGTPVSTPTTATSMTSTTSTSTSTSSGSGGARGGRSSSEVRASRSDSASSQMSMASKRTAAIQDLAAVSTIIGARSQIEMFPIDALLIFDVHSLCLHLRRSLGVVLAVREAMWEELQSLVTSPRSDVDLDKYGFYVHEDTIESMRAKYVQLLDQYKRCVGSSARGFGLA